MQQSGLPIKIILTLFLTKVLVGLVLGKAMENTNSVDSWVFHFRALDEYQLLWKNPSEYFLNIFQSTHSGKYAGLLLTKDSYWNDLKTNLMVKIVSVLHIFSRGNYYTNVILYNFLTFFGNIALFRVFKYVYKGNQYLLAGLVFLLPSVLLFSSFIHKEGIMYAALGIIFFNFYSVLNFPGKFVKRCLYILLGVSIIFLFRSFVVMALVPALAGWLFIHYRKSNTWITLLAVYAITLVVFFNVHFLVPSINLPQSFVERQAAFFNLEKGNTFIDLPVLQPTVESFATNFPAAVNHSLLRPFFSDLKLSMQLLPLAIELIIYQFALLCFIFFRNKTNFFDPFVASAIFFALFLLVIIGYIVPNIGAIVRYRSIYLPFIIAPILMNISEKKVKAFLRIIK